MKLSKDASASSCAFLRQRSLPRVRGVEGKVDEDGTSGDSSHTERVVSASGDAKSAGIAGTGGISPMLSLLRDDESEVKDLTRSRNGRSTFLATGAGEEVAPADGDDENGRDSPGLGGLCCSVDVEGEAGYGEASCDGALLAPFDDVMEPLTLVKSPPNMLRGLSCIVLAV